MDQIKDVCLPFPVLIKLLFPRELVPCKHSLLQHRSAKPKVFEKEVRASSFSVRLRYFRGSISEVKSSEDINNYGASSSRVSLSAELLWRR